MILSEGNHVYIMHDATVCGLHTTPREVVRSFQCAEVNDALLADVVVARAPGGLPFDVQWRCFLKGCLPYVRRL